MGRRSRVPDTLLVNFSACRSNDISTIGVLACVVFNFSACRSNGNFQMRRASVAVESIGTMVSFE